MKMKVRYKSEYHVKYKLGISQNNIIKLPKLFR